jgi:acyl-CoA thioesterase I
VEKRRSAFILTVWFAAAFCLGGCSHQPQQQAQASNQQGRSQAAASSVAAPTTSDSRPVIVAFGDSLTAGVVEHTYPQYLQNLLDAGGYAYRIDNQGVSGDTTTDGLTRIGNVLDAHPLLVILEFGGNDGLRGVPVDSIRTNLEAMIARLEAAKVPIVLAGITLPPNYGIDYVRDFTAMYPELAHKHHLHYIPFLLLNVYQHPDMMQPDGIHPSDKGNTIVAQDVFNLIRPMLKKGPPEGAHG